MPAVDRVARARLGARDRTGAALAAAVAALSERYTTARHVLGAGEGAGELAARLRFFLPRDLAKVELALGELALAGALPARARWRVLDLGAGLGTTTLGAARFARRHGGVEALDVVAVDRDEAALGVLDALARATRDDGELARVAVPVEVRTQVGDLEAAVAASASASASATAGPPFDLILVGLALNELWASAPHDDAIARRAALLVTLTDALAPDGSLVVIEPALRATARALQAVRDVLAARAEPPHVFAPCLRAGPCPMLATERDWCHDDVPFALPPELETVAHDAGLRHEDLTSSHLTLRRDYRRLGDALASLPGTPLRIVSERLESKGKVELFACGEPGVVRLMLLDRHRGPDTRVLDEARRGTLCAIEGQAIDGARVRIGPGTRARGPCAPE